MDLQSTNQLHQDQPTFSAKIWSLRQLLPNNDQLTVEEDKRCYQSMMDLDGFDELLNFKIPLNKTEESGLSQIPCLGDAKELLIEYKCSENTTSMMTSNRQNHSLTIENKPSEMPKPFKLTEQDPFLKVPKNGKKVKKPCKNTSTKNIKSCSSHTTKESLFIEETGSQEIIDAHSKRSKNAFKFSLK